MKKLLPVILVIFFFLQSFCFAWEWEPFGPPDIKANKICFFDTGPVFNVICIDTGMYISSFSSYFEFYSYTNMAVIEAVSPGLNEDSIIVVMSDGSWSDGIYSFKVSTGQFHVLQFCYHPNFIVYGYENEKYFVGYEYGLLYSEDAINWTNVAYFDNKACIDMATNGAEIVLATNEEFDNTYISEDVGATWTQLEGVQITDIETGEFQYYGFYGINRQEYNGGLYRLENDQWELEFYSEYLNALGMVNFNSLFVGWNSGVSPEIGIASYDGQLSFMNDGLPDLNINDISSPLIFGATVVYCCTETGCYSRILSVGVQQNQIMEKICIYPNPVSSEMFIKLNLAEPIDNIKTITILNNHGEIVDNLIYENRYSSEIEIMWNKGNLPSGVYYLVIKTGKEQITEKFIIL